MIRSKDGRGHIGRSTSTAPLLYIWMLQYYTLIIFLANEQLGLLVAGMYMAISGA